MNIRELLRECYRLAAQSPDPSTQNGAMVLDEYGTMIGEGYNCFPEGVEYKPERWERPAKYDYIEHAERNAIFDAAKYGRATHGGTLVCTWACCPECARAAKQAGICQVITHKQSVDRSSDEWRARIEVAFTILREANVGIALWDGVVGVEKPVLHSGQLWTP